MLKNLVVVSHYFTDLSPKGCDCLMILYRQVVARTFSEIRVKSGESERGVIARIHAMRKEGFLVLMVGKGAIVYR